MESDSIVAKRARSLHLQDRMDIRGVHACIGR